MQEKYLNIYKTARKAAGLTQEAAAEGLGICVESIRAYETGIRVPPNEVVEQMVIRYNAQHLAFQHLHETNTLAARIVPVLEPRSLMEAVVRLNNRFNRFTAQHGVDRLMEIAEDNRVSEDERDDYDAICEVLREIAQVSLELEVSCQPGPQD